MAPVRLHANARRYQGIKMRRYALFTPRASYQGRADFNT